MLSGTIRTNLRLKLTVHVCRPDWLNCRCTNCKWYGYVMSHGGSRGHRVKGRRWSNQVAQVARKDCAEHCLLINIYLNEIHASSDIQKWSVQRIPPQNGASSRELLLSKAYSSSFFGRWASSMACSC